MANPNIKGIYLPLARVHVNAGWKWAHEVGTDYWLQPSQGLNHIGTASTAVGPLLIENGWLATSLLTVAGNDADFRGGTFTPGTDKSRGGSYADAGIPTHFLTDADNDLLESPAMFGDAAHMQMAAAIAGQANLPNLLIAEFWGAMTVHTTDEKDAAWGFWQDGGSALTASEAIAAIYSDSANFALQAAGAVLGSAGAADDANWHFFRIELDFNGFISWSIDVDLQ